MGFSTGGGGQAEAQILTDISDAGKQSAMTATLTTVTHDEPGTPDYSMNGITAISPYGFATQDECETLLKVVVNLQTRVNELEAIVEALGLATAN